MMSTIYGQFTVAAKAHCLCFLGHTDVVPSGDESLWKTPPYCASVEGDYLYGRGAADMKSGVACFAIAASEFVAKYPKFCGTIAVALTADEEGIAKDGIKYLADKIKDDYKIDYCLVGEPSSTHTLGDVIKIGRRGSLTLYFDIYGKQGHVAYPHQAENPIDIGVKIINELIAQKWAKANRFFPSTSMQVVKVQSGVADNVIPQTMQFQLNFRYNPDDNAKTIKQKVLAIVKKHAQKFKCTENHSAKPFFSQSNHLRNICNEVIKENLNIDTKFSTTGGTSDGRFIAPLGAEIVEIGVINKTIHQVNECVKVADISKLKNLYYRILEKALL